MPFHLRPQSGPDQLIEVPMTDSIQIMDDNQLRLKAISALNQELGVAGTLRFLALIHQSPTDYMEISCHLYEGQSLDDIFARAKENWQG
jgi:hypothetical protein